MRELNENYHEMLEKRALEKALEKKGLLPPNPQRAELEMRLHLNDMLARKDGSPIPDDAVIFTVGERVEVKGCAYVVQAIDRKRLTLRPVNPEEA